MAVSLYGNFVLGTFNAVARNHVWISIGGGLIPFRKTPFPPLFSDSLSHTCWDASSKYIFFPLKIYLSNGYIDLLTLYISYYWYKCNCLTYILYIYFPQALKYRIVGVPAPFSSFVIVVCKRSVTHKLIYISCIVHIIIYMYVVR